MGWFAPATLALIGWGALAFGCEYPWAYGPLLVFGATVGALGLIARVPGAGHFPPLALALGLIVVAASIQAIPLPEPVVAAVSPGRAAQDWRALYAAELPGTTAPAGAAGRDGSTLSIEPSRTLLGLAFAAGLSLFFLGTARALTAVRASGVARGLIVLGAIVALIGIVQAASGSRLVYGVWYPRKAWVPAAPFINPNHFAGWVLMALCVAVGHLSGSVARAMRGVRPDWRHRAVWLGSREANEIVLVGFAVLVMALSILVTRSVSGMLCLVAALAAAGWWAWLEQRGRRRRVLLPVALTAALAVAAAWAGLDAVGAEIATTLASAFDAGGRIGLWRDTLRIVGDFPFTGTGFNTYGIAMLAYQTRGLELRAVEAHNDYLQLAAEGGVLVGLPIALAAGVFVREVCRRFHEAGDDTQTWWLRVGAVTGLAALALQAMVDFSLQMPGNAALFALLMAIAVHRPHPGAAQSVRTHGGAPPPSRSQS